MKILYIDTSCSYLYTGIVENKKLVAEIKEKLELDLSKMALPKIASMFEEKRLSPTDIDKIIVVSGPGSFTGIRIGLTIAKVYAWSLNIPIIPITSLETMALSCSNKKVIPLIDARRGYVYAAAYDNEMEVLKPQYLKLDLLYSMVKDIETYTFISNDEFDLKSKKCKYNPDIVTIVNNYCQHKGINPHLVNPEYLKLTEAEESRI